MKTKIVMNENPTNMGRWKIKKSEKLRRGNSTSGKDKGFNCKANARSKYMAKRSRSYKDKEYGVWCEHKHGGMNGPIVSEG